jgi:hypothetical protein
LRGEVGAKRRVNRRAYITIICDSPGPAGSLG